MKKSTKIVLIVLAIVIPIVLLIGGGLLILGIVVIGGANSVISGLDENTTHTRYDLVGTWYDSTKKVNIAIGSYNTIEFYTDDRKTLYMKGTYTIEQDYDNDMGDEYIITITTYDRVIDGTKYTDKYTTQFSIVTEDYSSAVMMNVVSYTLYYLTKISDTTINTNSSSYINSSSNTISNTTNTTNTTNTINSITNTSTKTKTNTNTISNNTTPLNTVFYNENTTSYNSNSVNTQH